MSVSAHDVGCRCKACAQHQPRAFARGRIRSEIEPQRIARRDEQAYTDEIRRRERDNARDDVAQLIAGVTAEVELLRIRLRQLPGNHRDSLRLVDRGLKAIARTVSQ